MLRIFLLILALNFFSLTYAENNSVNNIHSCGITPQNKMVLSAFYYFGSHIVTPETLDKYKSSIAHLDVLNYSVAGINEESTLTLGEITAQNILTIQKWIKDNHLKTKLVLSIGHWAAKNSLKIFTDLSIRKKFNNSVVALLKNPSYGLKGVDIDWENVFEEGTGGVKQFSSMITDLRASFDKAGLHNMCLSVDLPMGKFAKIYPAPTGWASPINWANLMAYAFYGEPHNTELDGALGLVGAQYGEKAPSYGTTSISSTLEYYISHGLPKDKVLIGLPYYALGNYTRHGGSGAQYSLRQRILPHSPLMILSYSGVAERYGTFKNPKRPGTIHQYTFVAPPNVKGTHAYWISELLVESKELGKTYEFISYQDPDAVKDVAQFAMKNGYLGFSAWQLTDDLPFTNKNSILRTLYDAITPPSIKK